MTQTVSVEDVTSVDASGDPTFSAARSIACRHQRKRVTLRDAAGMEISADDILYTYSAIAVGARVTFAGETQARSVLAVASSPSTTGGPTLYKVIPSGKGG